MTIGERLRKLRTELGFTLEEVSRQLNFSRQTLQRYESGVITNIPSDKIEALSNVYKVSPAYIMGWEDLKNNKPNNQTPLPSGKLVPVLGTVAAGIPIEAIEDIEDYEEISEMMAAKGEYFALKIKGESMEPKFSDGDVVIVRKQEDIESGEIGVIIVNGYDATVKKVIKQENGIMLIATNQNVYAPKFYSLDDIKNKPVRILGKVVELRAKF